jgi:hypothetical protein
LDGVIRAAQSSAYMVRVYRRVILCLVPPCALGTGNLALIRTAAAELPQINLDDALRICLVIREREPASFDRAACRWLARYAKERRATLARLAVAVAALNLCPRTPIFAFEVLERL